MSIHRNLKKFDTKEDLDKLSKDFEMKINCCKHHTKIEKQDNTNLMLMLNFL